MDHIEIDIDIGYPLYVSNQLKGNIDYFVRSEISLIVIEAKQADMEKGFSLLAVELIAADKYIEESDASIYGAVTVGDLWRFGELDRKEKLVSKDIDSYRVPSDLEELFSVLTGILGQKIGYEERQAKRKSHHPTPNRGTPQTAGRSGS